MDVQATTQTLVITYSTFDKGSYLLHFSTLDDEPFRM